MDPLAATIQDELSAWLPRLIRLWRRESGSKWSDAPPDRLLPAEAKSVAAGLQRLSQGLTRERQLAGEVYFSDPAQAGAYLLYFWPVSYAQARLALSLLPDPPCSVLELGSAAGPLSAAAASLGCRNLHLVDRSAKALGWGRLLLQAEGATVTVSQQDLSRNTRLAVGSYDLIAAQHLGNELWLGDPGRPGKIAGMLSGLKDRLSGQGHLLLVEPALKNTSQAALQVRDRLLQNGWAARFPCLHQQPCPTLAAGDSCHAESEWSAPEAVHALWQRAGLHKRILKMTLLLFSPAVPESSGPERWLAVSEPRRLRTREIEVLACGAGQRVAFRLAPADAADANRVLFKLKPGEIITLKGVAGEGTTRRLGPESRVERVSPARSGLQIRA
ncbi:MAG: small ribosomal subunit Rsm22 family protein [candidate division FCPU426 bacterium]